MQESLARDYNPSIRNWWKQMRALVMIMNRLEPDYFLELVDTIDISIPEHFEKVDLIECLSVHIDANRKLHEEEITFERQYVLVKPNKNKYGHYPYDELNIELNPKDYGDSPLW